MVQTPWCQRWAGQEGAVEEAPVGEVAGTLAPEPAAPAPEEQPPEPEPVAKPPPAPRGPLRPALVSVRGGTFLMGSPEEALTWEGDRKAYEDELPQRELTIPAFQMCKTEVTQAHYEAVMGTNPSDCSSGCGDTLPVQGVSWYDAVAYLNKLTSWSPRRSWPRGGGAHGLLRGQRRGRAWVSGLYRLSAAHRGRVGVRRAGGDDDELELRGGSRRRRGLRLVFGNAEARSTRSGQEANEWGLSDMYGNVWEWVWDAYDSYKSGQSGKQLWYKSCASRRVVLQLARGDLRSADRYWLSPVLRNRYLGFRCARGAGPQR
jgi:formylglycine-generating enzyme required for sulfatase activity